MEKKPHGSLVPLGIAILILGMFFGRDAGAALPVIGRTLLTAIAGGLVGVQSTRSGRGAVAVRESVLIALGGLLAAILVAAARGAATPVGWAPLSWGVPRGRFSVRG